MRNRQASGALEIGKHGSWLNAAENELSSMTRQCVHAAAFSTIGSLGKETKTWLEHSDRRKRGATGKSNPKTPEQNSSRFSPMSKPDKPLDLIH